MNSFIRDHSSRQTECLEYLRQIYPRSKPRKASRPRGKQQREIRVLRNAFIISLIIHALVIFFPLGFTFTTPKITSPIIEVELVELEREVQSPKSPVKSLRSHGAGKIQGQKKDISQEKREKVVDPILAYCSLIRKRIEELKKYPNWAKEESVGGKVYLEFLVLRSGEIKGIRIIQTSGNKRLDQEAIATINRAIPYPPIPEEIDKESLWVKLPITFRLD